MDVTVQLKEDFIVIDILQNATSSTEFHIYPVVQPTIAQPRHQQPLNVIMIMSDSISRPDAQRYMRDTYGTMEKNPDSFILKVKFDKREN